MPLTITTLKLSDEMLEHYDVLANRMGKPRSELMRSALQQVMDGNPVEPEEVARYRAKKAAGKARLSVGPGGKLIARVERPEIQATYELAQAVRDGRASLAADAPRRGRKERRERESNPESHPVHPTRLSGSTRALRPSSRPAVRPDRTARRTLRAV